MKKEKLIKLLEAINEQGYEIITLDASKLGRAVIEIGIPAFVNAKGLPVDPETGELIPHFL